MKLINSNKDKVAAQRELVNTSPEELVIRNATESLTLISGFHGKRDEAIYAEQDYGAMINQFKLVAKERILLKLFPFQIILRGSGNCVAI